jgi:hypothetical protein
MTSTRDSTVRTRSYLPPRSTAAHAPARSEVARSLAGRAAWLWEHITTKMDRSGPPFGAAQRVTLWAGQGIGDYTDVEHPRDYNVVFGAAVPDTSASLRGVMVCRSHALLPPPWIAPLSRAHATMRLILTGSGTSTVRLVARNTESGETTSTIHTVTTTDTTLSPADLWVETTPGLVRFSLLARIIAGDHTAIAIKHAALFVRAKRSHHLTFPG